MLDRPHRQGLALPWKAGDDMMAGNGSDQNKARRFRDAALPHLDDVYTLARYLLRDSADAEDAAQECYLRGLRYFDTFRGTEIKPWLFAILRNICRGEFARRSRVTLAVDDTTDDAEDAPSLWQEEQPSAETKMLVRLETDTNQSRSIKFFKFRRINEPDQALKSSSSGVENKHASIKIN